MLLLGHSSSTLSEDWELAEKWQQNKTYKTYIKCRDQVEQENLY